MVLISPSGKNRIKMKSPVILVAVATFFVVLSTIAAAPKKPRDDVYDVKLCLEQCLVCFDGKDEKYLMPCANEFCMMDFLQGIPASRLLLYKCPSLKKLEIGMWRRK
ncbi:uncharacterized protein LOC106171037 [Lingula anatina]|uniref:Uncharacterized protein LOC106171037 n=1 Tax=Lingula anatina TaxID=7574 RepID=A0A1S3J8N3_LINAN|nr:uncharacterized protein LOC106171037 [Lingula anatina]|eukprot:XP_013406581.1 uncharacterized protein LOC106171037 [Lingula anatina]